MVELIPIPEKEDKYKVTFSQWSEVEIGDVDNIDFKPHIKIKKWGEECYLSVKYPTSKKIKPVKEIDNGKEKLKWKDDDKEIHFYILDEYGEYEKSSEGGFEYEIIFKKKPDSNIVEFDVQTVGLKFYYQPPLTEEEKTGVERAIRPDSVIGSYAVYHATKQAIYSSEFDANKYKVGKAFHIYRPKAIDANTVEKWCDLNVDDINNKLTITIPQSFLDDATYPVKIDPTFGYTIAGGTSSYSDRISGCKFTSPVVGTISSMTVYVIGNAASTLGGSAIYSDNAGAPSALLASHNPDITLTTTAQWNTSKISYIMSASTAYWLCDWCDKPVTARNYYYDAGDTNQRFYDNSGLQTFPTWPATITTPAYSARKQSIYATYTSKKHRIDARSHVSRYIRVS